MRKEFKAITINLDPEIYDLLKSMQTPKKPSVSSIIREILLDYFISKGKKEEPVVIVGEPLRNKESKQPNKIEEISKGIQIPEITPIVKNKSISVPSGITPRDLIIARRAKKMGRPYDKSLEPFFDGNTEN